MTTANGTITVCAISTSDSVYALNFTCFGPSCTSLGQNFTCNNSTSSIYTCTNGLIFPSSTSSRFISTFSFAQPNFTVTSTQNITVNGSSYLLTQSGDGNVTIANGSTSTATKSAGLISYSPSWKLIFFLFSISLFWTIIGAEFICISQIQSALGLTGDTVEGIATGSLSKVVTDICSQFASDLLKKQTSATAAEYASQIAICEEQVLVAEVAVLAPQGQLGERQAGAGVLPFPAFPVLPAEPGIPITAEALLAAFEVAALRVPAAVPAVEAAVVEAAAAALLVGVTNTLVCAYFVHCMFDQLYGAAGDTICSCAAPSSTTTIIVNKPTPEPSPTSTSAPAIITTGSPTSSLLPVPSISISSTGAQCMLCVIEQWLEFFPAYWCDQPGVGSQPISNYYLPAKDMMHIFCDPSVASDPDFQQFCLQACTYLCNQFNTTAWVNEYESTLPANKICPDVCDSLGTGMCPPQFVAYDVNCTGLCPGAEACGWCDVVNESAYPGG